MIDALRARVARFLPSPRLRAGATGQPRCPVKRIVVFGRYPNPTSDYYFAGRLAAHNMPEHVFADIREGELAGIDPDGAFVIICRYASAPVLNWIEREGCRLAGVALFLDDDIPATVVSRDASVDYKLFLIFRALLPLRRLNQHLDMVWASTPRLAERLPAAKTKVLPPAPPAALWNVTRSNEEQESILIAYHATAVHVEEHKFLQPIIRDILGERPNVHFEVFAGRKAARLWAGMDRVTIRRPIPWNMYLAEASARRIHIMLAPLSPSPVNECRSPTKRIDVARFGAAGVFSISEAYGHPRGDAEILVPYEPAAWRDAILLLITDTGRLWAAAEATRLRVAAMSREADNGLDLFQS